MANLSRRRFFGLPVAAPFLAVGAAVTAPARPADAAWLTVDRIAQKYFGGDCRVLFDSGDLRDAFIGKPIPIEHAAPGFLSQLRAVLDDRYTVRWERRKTPEEIREDDEYRRAVLAAIEAETDRLIAEDATETASEHSSDEPRLRSASEDIPGPHSQFPASVAPGEGC